MNERSLARLYQWPQTATPKSERAGLVAQAGAVGLSPGLFTEAATPANANLSADDSQAHAESEW